MRTSSSSFLLFHMDIILLLVFVWSIVNHILDARFISFTEFIHEILLLEQSTLCSIVEHLMSLWRAEALVTIYTIAAILLTLILLGVGFVILLKFVAVDSLYLKTITLNKLWMDQLILRS